MRDVGERDRFDESSSEAAESAFRFDHDTLSVGVNDQAVAYRVDEVQEVHPCPLITLAMML